jgi:CRISPR-associated protein Cmr2
MPFEPWESLLLAWLHDPVDKAADILDHAARARRYAAIVLGREVADGELGDTFDLSAPAYEGLPYPPPDGGALRVGPSLDDNLLLYHPLSAESRRVKVSLNPAGTIGKLGALVDDRMSMKRRFLSLWRLAPDLFPESPADALCPDHTLWQHLDTTAAVTWATKDDAGGVALLSFKLSPVQPFIEASRSLRDLLSGSYLLSWLCFAAMGPVLESCGPTALVYPALRRIPLMDWWLGQRGVAVKPDPAKLARASLPNRFLAIVPRSQAADLARAVRGAAHDAWLAAARDVHRELARKYDHEFPGWDRLWDQQIDGYFDFRSTWLALADANAEHAFSVEDREGAHRDAKINGAGAAPTALLGQWQSAVELSAGLMKASGQIRHIPQYRPEGDVPQKCTLLGTYEQMGPSRLADSRRFWELESKDKEDADRRCAITLVKKHAFFAHLRHKVKFDLDDIRFPDTTEIAGGENNYYAVLSMDGDDMGAWLSGENSPRVREILHPDAVACYERDPATRSGLNARRPVSPALHAAISQALTHFAVDVAPDIVEHHGGRLIYSGGDDLLAALPLTSALKCARELRDGFRSPDVMGCRSGISAGMAVAHSKEDLRYVLDSARRAERQSKKEGKDRLTLAILRRSGEHAFASCAWDYVPVLQRQVEAFRAGGSDRWAYQLRRHLAILNALDPDAFRAELRRTIQHGEKPNLQFIADFDAFAARYQPGEAAEPFVTLCQSASFLARGKEDR